MGGGDADDGGAGGRLNTTTRRDIFGIGDSIGTITGRHLLAHRARHMNCEWTWPRDSTKTTICNDLSLRSAFARAERCRVVSETASEPLLHHSPVRRDINLAGVWLHDRGTGGPGDRDTKGPEYRRTAPNPSLSCSAGWFLVAPPVISVAPPGCPMF